MGNLLGTTASFFISGLVLVLLVAALLAVHRKLLHLYKDKPFESNFLTPVGSAQKMPVPSDGDVAQLVRARHS
jgi:hypothetical protein